MRKNKYNQNVLPTYEGDEPAVYLGAWFDAADAATLTHIANRLNLSHDEVILRAVRLAGMTLALRHHEEQLSTVDPPEGVIW